MKAVGSASHLDKTLATVLIPAQDISGPGNLEQSDRLAISPWRTREDHRPLGEINRLRRSIHTRSAQLRRHINGQDPAEPTTPDFSRPAAPDG